MKNKKTEFACTKADMHPYECDGACEHCKKTVSENHNPKNCWLCNDGDPKLSKNNLGKTGFIVHGYRVKPFEVLVGELLTMIEMLDLPEKQESSAKNLIKNKVWDMYDKPSYSYNYVDDKMVD